MREGAYQKIIQEPSIQETIDSVQRNIHNIYLDLVKKSNEVTKLYTEIFLYQEDLGDEKLTLDDFEELSEKQKKEYQLYEGVYQKVIQTPSIQEELQIIQKEYQEELEKLKAISDNTIQQQEQKMKNVIEEYKKKIEDLLPGATAAGLSEYFQRKIDEQKRTIWIWIISFGSSIAGMFYMTTSYILPHLQEIHTLLNIIIQLCKTISTNFPFIWLALFSLHKLAQTTRIYEEYCHKKAISQTYVGMRDSINTISENEHSNSLTKQYIESVFYNPSETLDKQDTSKTPLTWFTQLLKFAKKQELNINITQKEENKNKENTTDE